MSNLRKYYYDNKSKIWKTILIIVSIFAVIYGVNYLMKIRSENYNTLAQNIIPQQNTVVDNTSLTTNESVVGGVTLDENSLQEDITIIEEFLNYCNNKEFEKAYELLSTSCKENVFNSFDQFKTSYCDQIFNTPKTYTTENWSGNIYRVRLVEDILATGQSSSSGSAIQDWITVVTEEDQEKLNINNYIGERNFSDTSSTTNDITIKMISENIYKDYENLTFEVTNNTENTIYLDDGEDPSTLYITDSNRVEHEASTGEIIYSTLTLLPGQTKRFTIKFTNTYISNRTITALTFSRVILNYDEYLRNTEDYDDTVSITINM